MGGAATPRRAPLCEWRAAVRAPGPLRRLEEVVATIQHLIESGKVTLVGNFRSRDLRKSS